MLLETLSVFPQVFAPYLDESIMGRAQRAGIFRFAAHDLRDWTHDRHRTVDDAPFGGGQGMLMKPEPIFEAVEDIAAQGEERPHVVFFSPCGRRFDQACAERLAERERVLFVCGRYEAVVRLLPGALGDDMSAKDESFSSGLLEYAQYTRPADFRGMRVPDVLLSGDHAAVDRWRRESALERTVRWRPDILDSADLTEAERDRARQIASEVEFARADDTKDEDLTGGAVDGES